MWPAVILDRIQRHCSSWQTFQKSFVDNVDEGLELVHGTIFVTILFEIYSRETVQCIWNQQHPNGKTLYGQAIWSNMRNHYLIGVPGYTLAALFLCRGKDEQDDYYHSKTCWWWWWWWYRTMFDTMAIVAIHNVLYWYLHRLSHKYPSLYKYHKFHHQFREFVVPLAANAVSFVEYTIAYVLPLAIAALWINPSRTSLYYAVVWETWTNILVHTPKLARLSQQWLPPYFVATLDHIEHHKRLSTNYASPVWNIDWILYQLQPLFYTDKSFFLDPPVRLVSSNNNSIGPPPKKYE